MCPSQLVLVVQLMSLRVMKWKDRNSCWTISSPYFRPAFCLMFLKYAGSILPNICILALKSYSNLSFDDRTVVAVVILQGEVQIYQEKQFPIDSIYLQEKSLLFFC